MSDTESRKRARQDDPSDDVSSSEDDFGPALPSSVPPKKKRKLPFEALYVAALPKGLKYSKSLMHRDQVAFVDVAAAPVDFVMTASIDGVVKFWKKVASGIEFAKEYRAHEGKVRSTCVSSDGAYYATAGDESLETDGINPAPRTVKIFDVVTFDLLTILDLRHSDAGPDPASDAVVCWVHRRGSPPTLAVAEGKSIRIFDVRGDVQTPVHTLSTIHRGNVVAMAYNAVFDCVISADAAGFVEYWRPSDNYEKPDEVFKMKSSTDLFDFKKSKSAPCSISISANGHRFATFSFPDRKVRVFDFLTGKLHRSYDESLETSTAMQQAGRESSRLTDVEFGRRLATERELDNPTTRPRINISFDESGNFICYGSLLGVKVVNTTTNRVMRSYGREESFRPLHVALYQGAPQQKGVVTVSMAASANPLLHEAEERDPILFTTGYGKVRFYMFTNEEQVNKSDRDVHNEQPRAASSKKKEEKKSQTGVAATLHTTFGDIYIRLFPDAAPKTVENFVTHARNGYYNNTIFHRVIKGFMIQGGDPLGDGTGGESIWGKEFEDEISSHKHDKPYTLSMANAGPGTNGSQFFVTTAPAAWLDGKHTVFGRAYKGMDVVHQIENTPVVKEKPKEDIKIVNITIG